MKDIFLALNQRDFADTIRYYIKCCQDNTSFYLKDSRGNYIGCKVSQAPEPEDIIWTNLGRTECETIKNKLYTFTISFLLLIISFGLVYGLSAAQYSNQHNKTLSYAISLIISINNVVISRNSGFIQRFWGCWLWKKGISLLLKCRLASDWRQLGFPSWTLFWSPS